MRTGTVQSQVGLQMLDLKWQKKKQDINQKKEGLSQEEILMQSYEEQAADIRKSRDTEQIYTKLKTGGTLTAEEIAYLKENDPEALAEYEKAQAEKRAYEQALKNCKTKDEVERLKFNRMGNFAAQAKSIANNPYIPKDKKLELMNKLNNEVSCIRDAHMAFVKSRAYEELPQEAEIAEERAQERSAENEALLAEQMAAETPEVSAEQAGQMAAETEEVSAEQAGQMAAETEEVSAEQAGQMAAETEEVSAEQAGQMEAAETPEVSAEQAKQTETAEIEKVSAEQMETAETEELSFDRISRDIERFLRRNGGKKAHFVAHV